MAEVTVTTQTTLRVQLDAADELRISRLEQGMSENTDRINALTAEVEAWKADINAKVAALEAEIANSDAAESEAVSTALDDLKTSIDAGVATVGDANADGTPAAEPAPEPGA